MALVFCVLHKQVRVLIRILMSHESNELPNDKSSFILLQNESKMIDMKNQ